MKQKKFDYYLFIIVILISLFGVVMIYSSSNVWALYKYNDALKYVKSQSIFLLLGVIIMYVVSKIDYKIYNKKANLILLICFLLLGLVLIPGIGIVRNGSRSWFGIGSLGIQPSEAAKVGLIIFVSKYLANNQKLVNSFKKGLLPILLVIFAFFILILLEPDFGTAMVMVLTLVGLLFSSSANMGFFVKVGIVGVLGIAGIIIVAPYRVARILSFLDPWTDPLGSGFQIIQSLYAIGPGGLLGMGFLNSRQKHFYLPEPQTDFIFSIISEEFGFLGVLIVCSAFAFIFYRCIKISLRTNDLFAKYLVFGLSFGIILQAILNLCVVVGLIPVTGFALLLYSLQSLKKRLILRDKTRYKKI